MTLSIIRAIVGIIGIFSTTLNESPMKDFLRINKFAMIKFVFSSICMCIALGISIFQRTPFFYAQLCIYLTFLGLQTYDFLEDIYISTKPAFSFDTHIVANIIHKISSFGLILGILGFLVLNLYGITTVSKFDKEIVRVEYEVENITDISSLEDIKEDGSDLFYPISSGDITSYLKFENDKVVSIEEIKNELESTNEGYLKVLKIEIYYSFVNISDKYYKLYNWMNEAEPEVFSFYIID